MVIKKYYFKKIKSTNDQAIKMIKRGLSKGIIITEEQTDGRGQHGNKWISLKGNLFMTIFFEINKKGKISELTKSLRNTPGDTQSVKNLRALFFPTVTRSQLILA